MHDKLVAQMMTSRNLNTVIFGFTGKTGEKPEPLSFLNTSTG